MGWAESIVFEGAPDIKGVNTLQDVFNEPVNDENKKTSRLVITKENGQYIWFSREKNKLRFYKDDNFIYFVREDRPDYIKISKPPQSEGKYIYMEHMSDGMKTLTYWGKSDKLEL